MLFSTGVGTTSLSNTLDRNNDVVDLDPIAFSFIERCSTTLNAGSEAIEPLLLEGGKLDGHTALFADPPYPGQRLPTHIGTSLVPGVGFDETFLADLLHYTSGAGINLRGSICETSAASMRRYLS